MGESDSSLIAGEAACRFGQSSAEPKLIRRGANDVYVVGDLLVRVARSGVDVERHIRVAEVLIRSGIAVPEPVGTGEADRVKYSVWEYIKADRGVPIDFEQLGRNISVLHDLDPLKFAEFNLPWCGEFGWLDVVRNLEAARAADVVAKSDLDALEIHANRLRSWEGTCRAASRQVVCHGDVHPGNVIMRGGKAFVIDWDTICVGPPQWDHAPLLTWSDRWGGQLSDYRDFSAGYGNSFQTDALAREMAEVRLLAPTINMIVRGSDDERFAAEAKRRMRFWLGDPDAPSWSAQ